LKNVFNIAENKKHLTKRYDVSVYANDEWFKIASVYSDAEWFLNWLNENLKSNPPTIGEKK
jgi:hypothetical protein